MAGGRAWGEEAMVVTGRLLTKEKMSGGLSVHTAPRSPARTHPTLRGAVGSAVLLQDLAEEEASSGQRNEQHGKSVERKHVFIKARSRNWFGSCTNPLIFHMRKQIQ